ncbi:MAG TPA: flagellar hook protein FlgE, partial [Nitrospiria bacterium]|nr:flagellar hook protein FlgE [Nitrospiria bacterium]
MAILTSLFTGVSGLDAFGTGLSVVSNNIANMNTTGFKSGSVSFADIISQTLSGATATSQVGRGVYVNGITTQFDQGSFETTSNGLDLAIEGDGFFSVRDPSGAIAYTRAGSFAVNVNGDVATPDGFVLQGYQADPAGNLTGQVADLNLASSTFPPLATTQASFVANVDSRVTIPPAFDVNNPSTTSNFSTSLTVYDSLGNGHLITVYFRKSLETPAGNTWEYFAVVNGSDSASGNTEIQAQGTLAFTTNGALDTESATVYPTGGFDFNGGATQNQTIALDFGDSITTNGGTGLLGVTQFGSSSAVVQQTQDGYASGSLQSVSVSKDGVITGLFTNGKNRTLGQVALARFTSPQGLVHLGDNLFGSTVDSGQPILGAPNAGGMGKVLSDSLELSNVDLAQQFVKMIEYQRGFQANSRVITTTDEILQELVNLRH